MKLTFWEIGEAVKATNDYRKWDDFAIEGIEFDARLIKENHLFIPLMGNTDGHSYIQQAVDNGAIATLWSHEEAPAIPYLQVTDTLQAMQDLAHYYRAKMNPSVIAITGSNGKTTTKDMTAAVAATKYNTYKTQGNYNNEIGMPYTILHMPDNTEVLVLEMGMDHAHQIEVLSEIAIPDVAAITLIGESHIEHLGSRAGIAKAKMEITAGLKQDGTLIVPADEPLLRPLMAAIPQTIRTFGLGDDAMVRAEVVKTDKTATTFTTNLFPGEITIPVLGDYNVKNALIALMVGTLLDIPFEQMKEGIENFHLTKQRTEWVGSSRGLEILSDVYNANPTAMKLVLDNFAKLDTDREKIAVLGDMLELGEQSLDMHASIANHLNPETIQTVYLYGTQMKSLYEALAEKYEASHLHYYPIDEKQALMEDLKENTDEHSMLILKASNGTGLAEVVEYIK